MKSCDDFLKEVEERVARATKGPWHIEPPYPTEVVAFSGPTSTFQLATCHIQDQGKNAEFIAASRTDVEVLASMVRAAKDALVDSCECEYISDVPPHMGVECEACNALIELDRLAGELP